MRCSLRFGGGPEQEVSVLKAGRSFVKIILSSAILIAAISVAYGSQVAIVEDSKNEMTVKEKAPSKSKDISFDSEAVKLNIDELRKEKYRLVEISERKKDEKLLRKEKTEKKKLTIVKGINRQSKSHINYEVKNSDNYAVESKVVAKSIKAYTNGISTKNQKVVSSNKITREEKIAAEQKRAEQILNAFILKYPILKGVKIYVKDCPNNWQGCAYYTKGIILIDPDHTAPLERIIEHEIKHIIDWREDYDIDYNDYYE